MLAAVLTQLDPPRGSCVLMTASFSLSTAPSIPNAVVAAANATGTCSISMPGGMEYYVLKHGEQELCGIMQIDPAWGDFAPQWVTYFLVANTDETAATIIKYGGKLMGNIDNSPFDRLAAVMDPSGATFKIIESPKS